MFYALATNEASIKDKVNLFVALAPVTRLDHCTNSLINKWTTGTLEPFLRFMGANALFGPKIQATLGLTCSLMRSLCDEIEGFNGKDNGGINISDIHNFRSPDTASTKELDHFSKIYNAGDFIDYEGNPIDLKRI